MSTNSQNHIIAAIKDIIAGTIGGIGLVAAGHPFDTLKVRLQTQSMEKPIYSGMMDCVKKTIQWEGIGGFYKGVASPLIGQMVFNAVQFCVYGQAKTLMKSKDAEFLTIPQYFGAGLLTGFCVAFVESPMDFLKSQIQVQILQQKLNPENYKPEFKGVIDCGGYVIKKYGLRGFYQGLAPTMLRDTLSVSVYFGVYEMIRRGFLKPGQTYADVDKLSAWNLFLAGGISGVAYWVSTYPIDVIKSRIMADSIHPELKKCRGIVSVGKMILKEGGTRALFRGFLPCLIRSFPANAACFVCYQKSIELMR